MAFCKEYNAQTAKMAGDVVPVEITVYEVRCRVPPRCSMQTHACAAHSLQCMRACESCAAARVAEAGASSSASGAQAPAATAAVAKAAQLSLHPPCGTPRLFL